MTDTYLLFPYIVTVIILVIIPGADTVMFLKALSSSGKNQALRLSFGVMGGCVCWGSIVLLGLGDYIYESDIFYNIIRYLGGAYLIYLAIDSLRGTSQGKSNPDASTQVRSDNWMARGFITNILNPKVGLFYIAVAPSFISLNAPFSTQMAFFIIIHVGIYFIWTLVLLSFANRITETFNKPGLKRKIDYTISLVFLLLSGNLIFLNG